MHHTTTTRRVSWGDGESPSSDDGCGFLIVRTVAVAACLIAALSLANVAWSGRRRG